MTARLTAIWRHPIKSHGREELQSVTLQQGQTMPWDRTWAVAHEAAKTDGTTWAPCVNFSIGAKAQSLQAISAGLDEAREIVTLRHPDRPDITIHPDRDQAAFLTWVAPLMPANRAASARIVRVPNRGMTDTDYPSVSLINLASHRALEAAMGMQLSPKRWRGNLLMDGLEAWQEFEWIGKSVRIGSVTVSIRERIRRCKATTANPDTGLSDADTLAALEANWAHRDMGVYAEVIQTGTIMVGDQIEVLA